jgi:PAS domain-containing protein
MPIQLRFVTLIASVMAILLVGLRVQQQWDEKETRLLQEAMAQERTELVSKMLDVTGEPMRVLVADYTLWDDMVNFVAKPDAEWARINITETGLTSHHVDAAWVFRPDLTEVFAGTLENRTELRAFPLAPEELAKVATGFAEMHFFVSTPAGLLEMRCAPVRPTDPKAVIPAPLGWMFAARLWDGPHLQRLALLTDSQTSLVPAGTAVADKPDDPMAITTRQSLADWQGRTIRELHVRHLPLALDRMRANNRVDLLISSAFSIIALVAFYFVTRQWVVRPLGALEASLAQRSAVPLARLHRSSREFARLGRLVEQSLQHEQTLRQVFAAFNAIEDAVLIVDTGTQRITHVNDGAVQLLGYRHEELHGKPLADLQGEPADPARPDTCWYRCRDGRLVEVEIREQALPASAVAPLRVIVARDVTLLRNQEQQRLQAQRLESLGNLAGGVAHDMNNMLTPITMFLEDLQHAGSRPSPELLASVRSSVRRGADMLRQLLTFGRGIAGERQPLAVTRLLDEIGRIVASTFPKSIQFESRPARNLSSILGDACRVTHELATWDV